MSDRSGSAGGAAMGAGADYQARVAALLGAYALAELDAQPPFRLTAPIEAIACEVADPVDDVVARTTSDHNAAIQAKRTVSLNRQREGAGGGLTPFASAIDQFVRQYHVAQARASSGEAAALDPRHDRFVLAVGPRTPTTIRQTLAGVLDRLRIQPAGEPLVTAVLNSSERAAAEALLGHARASWKDVTGSTPNDDDLLGFLRLLRVDTVAVEDGETDETTALTLLRQSVLEDPNDARDAWGVLIEIGSRLIATRGSIAVPELRSALAARGIRLRGARSYREDIERLRRHTTEVVAQLADYATVPLGTERVPIKRPYVSALRDAARDGAVLVVGEPGIGKSGLLHGLARELLDEGRDAVVLTPQDPPFSTLSELRDALRLEHDVADVLANWTGDTDGYLIVDALDAARTESAALALRQLIDRVQRAEGRWHVVASVREYDARYGRDLQRLFRGSPPEGPCPALPGSTFSQVRHLVVGPLTDGEVDQLESVVPRLHDLATTAPPALQHLFRTPFNLRLAAELLDTGTTPDQIREVQSQLDLLDLYWDERVLAGGARRQADARESVLTKAVHEMVTRRSLRADRRAVAREAGSEALNDLLSAHVLTEWKPAPESVPERYTLTFAHHVLFDYAVMRLLLPREPERLAEFLGSDPELVLLARPSLIMYFHERWARSPDGGRRREFWDAALAVAGTAEIPEIGKLLGPSIAADRIRSLSDLDPLINGLESDGPISAAAENAFYHLVRATRPLIADGEQRAAPQIEVLCALLERASRSFTDGTAYPARTVLWDLTERAEELEPRAFSAVGAASRRLLEFAWDSYPRDRNLVGHALQYVGRTFSSDAEASAQILRRAIAPEHLAAFGSEELRWIADETARIVKVDPTLVRDIYVAAFNYVEESDQPTPMGGLVMPLTSNRRQDYNGALYVLRQNFPSLIAASPEHAVTAMNAAVEAHVARERTPGESDRERSFDFHGIRARFAADYSHIWDRGHAYPGTYAVELLDAVESRIAELSEAGVDSEELRRWVELLAREARLAVIWRRLLRLGVRHPGTLGVLLRPLLCTDVILTGLDTSNAAGRLIEATAPHLPPEERERIELAIMAIPSNTDEDGREWGERIRDRLLGCFGEVELITEDAKARLSALRADDAVPPNDDDSPHFSVHSAAFGEEEYLAELGVPVDETANRRIRELEGPAKAFASEHSNSVADTDAVLGVLPELRALQTALASADAYGVHPKQAAHAWGVLADACRAVAAADDLSGAEGAEAFARGVLLAASDHPDPEPHPDADGQFVTPSWGKPAARIDAAAGLLALAKRSTKGSPDVSAALDDLATDPVPSVRYQLASALHFLYAPDAPDRCWSLLESMVEREMSPGVALGLLHGPLWALRFIDPDRVVPLTRTLYTRFGRGPASKEVRAAAVDVLANLYVAFGHTEAGSMIAAFPDRLLDNLDEAAHLVSGLREALVMGPADNSDPDADARRRRAIEFVLAVTRAAADVFHRGTAQSDPGEVGRPSDKQMESLVHLLDSVAINLYFVSGAYEDDEKADDPEPDVQARLLREAGPIIDELADVGLAPIAHHLLETLEVLIPHDPGGVFKRVVAVIRGGRKGHYQYDQMAEKVLVRVVERYLADYRSVFQHDEEARRALIEILDTFVRAGSEGARRLSYGLDGIFR